ncbi:MAG: Ppx/GppA phosphatase family protein [Planctomycetota bacterium]
MPDGALLECGSNSLKVHYRSPETGEYRGRKFGWRLGRDVYETGRASPKTAAEIIAILSELASEGFERDALLAIATEWLREAADRADVLGQLRDRLQLDVRVLSGREEASLLAEGYLRSGGALPASLLDLGGGSLQVVELSSEKTAVRDSLPLGAIRLWCLGKEEGKPWNRRFVEEHIEAQLENAAIPKSDRVTATGGTVRAAAQVLGKTRMAREEIEALLEDVASEGAPPALSPSRREVFLPGLLVLARILRAAEAKDLVYQPISVGRIFFERLLEKTGGRIPRTWKELALESLRVTAIIRRR